MHTAYTCPAHELSVYRSVRLNYDGSHRVYRCDMIVTYGAHRVYRCDIIVTHVAHGVYRCDRIVTLGSIWEREPT